MYLRLKHGKTKYLGGADPEINTYETDAEILDLFEALVKVTCFRNFEDADEHLLQGKDKIMTAI